jgi:uncharacterized protein YdaU (DUF1376 family)
MSVKKNPNDLRRNSEIIDQQPTVNRFMDQKEIEWQTQKLKEEGPKERKKGETTKEGEKKNENGQKEKKPNEEEDESKYFCCS